MAQPLRHDIKEDGVWQGDLVRLLSNIILMLDREEGDPSGHGVKQLNYQKEP